MAATLEFGGEVSVDDSHCLVMPARFISYDEAVAIVDAYLAAKFEGGRHQRRIDKIPVA